MCIHTVGSHKFTKKVLQYKIVNNYKQTGSSRWLKNYEFSRMCDGEVKKVSCGNESDK
jgi:hypothetical protein